MVSGTEGLAKCNLSESIHMDSSENNLLRHVPEGANTHKHLLTNQFYHNFPWWLTGKARTRLFPKES